MHKGEFLLVKWLKFHVNRVKLNTNGCAKGNSGPEGGGYIIRNADGGVICAQADAYGIITNMCAEARALAQGIALCRSHGFFEVDT